MSIDRGVRPPSALSKTMKAIESGRRRIEESSLARVTTFSRTGDEDRAVICSMVVVLDRYGDMTACETFIVPIVLDKAEGTAVQTWNTA